MYRPPASDSGVAEQECDRASGRQTKACLCSQNCHGGGSSIWLVDLALAAFGGSRIAKNIAPNLPPRPPVGGVRLR